MMVKLKGFFLRYVDKIFCGAVALFFIGALVHVILLNMAGDMDRMLAEMASHKETVRRGLADVEDIEIEVDESAYREKWARWAAAPEMDVELQDVFWPVIPQDYPEQVVGTDREHYLNFEAPIDPRSISVAVIEGDDVLSEDEDGEVFRHPADGDFSKVLIHLGPGEGKVRITATVGGRPHIKELTTDSSIRRQPAPPLALDFDGDFGQGRHVVELYFESDPVNKEGVIVKEYRIYRKRARNLLAEYERIGTIEVDFTELSEDGREKFEEEDFSSPEEDAPNEELSEEEDFSSTEVEYDTDAELLEDGTVRYTWHDDNVNPDEIFLYKVTTAGWQSQPEESEYSEMLRVRTPPVVDFFFDRRVGRDDELSFGVALEIDGEFDRTNITHFVGDMIGKPVYDDLGLAFFDTESILLDFQREALRRRPSYEKGRVVYIDKWGDIAARWRRHWGTGKDRRSDPW